MTVADDTIYNIRTGQKMIFRKTGQENNGAFLEMECFNPPTGVKEPEHIHPFQENSFEVISGELHFQINGKHCIGMAGDHIVIPPGTPHYFWNGGLTEAHYVQMFKPSLHIDCFFRSFFALARENKLNKKGLPNIFIISVLSLKHKNEIRLINPPWVLQKMIFALLAPVGWLLGYKTSYR
jgi:quercetin dioxygenase-like cupin family protein